jgi:hypothetical protein
MANATEVPLTAGAGADADDEFGYSVSISGNYAVVGARYDDEKGNNMIKTYFTEH